MIVGPVAISKKIADVDAEYLSCDSSWVSRDSSHEFRPCLSLNTRQPGQGACRNITHSLFSMMKSTLTPGQEACRRNTLSPLDDEVERRKSVISDFEPWSGSLQKHNMKSKGVHSRSLTFEPWSGSLQEQNMKSRILNPRS